MTKKYLERLKSILKYGLWLNGSKEDECEFVCRDQEKKRPCLQGKRPLREKVCFTELKLSQARPHAARYGRLGIAFKRPFVIERGGLPALYYPQWSQEWLKSLENPTMDFSGDLQACLMKPIGVGVRKDRHKYFDESEWRILCTDWLIKKYAKKPTRYPSFRKSLGTTKGPHYLLPVQSKWLAMIIYPSIQVLCESQRDREIRRLLKKIKNANKVLPEHTLQTGPYEGYTLPVEMDLDNCRNF